MERPSNQSLKRLLQCVCVLLAANLLVGLGQTGPDSRVTRQAHAADEQPRGIPNAGLQRKQILDRLDRVVDSNQQLVQMLSRGSARVNVENLQDLQQGE